MLATRGRADGPWRLARGMRGERPGRVRWGSAGRAAVVLALLALAIAWPRLAPPPPRLPSDAGIPVAPPEARAAGARGERAGRERAAERERARRRRAERRRRRSGGGAAERRRRRRRASASAAERRRAERRGERSGGRERAPGEAERRRRQAERSGERRGGGARRREPPTPRERRRRRRRRRPRTADVPPARSRDDGVLVRARVSARRPTAGWVERSSARRHECQLERPADRTLSPTRASSDTRASRGRDDLVAAAARSHPLLPSRGRSRGRAVS